MLPVRLDRSGSAMSYLAKLSLSWLVLCFLALFGTATLGCDVGPSDAIGHHHRSQPTVSSSPPLHDGHARNAVANTELGDDDAEESSAAWYHVCGIPSQLAHPCEQLRRALLKGHGAAHGYIVATFARRAQTVTRPPQPRGPPCV